MHPTNLRTLVHGPTLLVAALLMAPGLFAQDADPRREIQEIADRVAQQLQEVDQMLLQSRGAQQTRSRSSALLEQSMQRGAEAQQGIDELIDKLTKLKGT